MKQVDRDKLEKMIRSHPGMVEFRKKLVEIVREYISNAVQADVDGVGSIQGTLCQLCHGDLLEVTATRVANYKKIFVEVVEREVERLIRIFIVKQIEKVGLIVGNRKYKAEIDFFEGDKWKLPGGWLSFEFKNKSSFRMKTRVVFTHSKFDFHFERYPSTFHEVKVKGSKPRLPKNKRMSWNWMVHNFK